MDDSEESHPKRKFLHPERHPCSQKKVALPAKICRSGLGPSERHMCELHITKQDITECVNKKSLKIQTKH